MKSKQCMRIFGLLGLFAILGAVHEIPSFTIASAQSVISSHCTASNPCMDICGDHVCTPGELAQMKAKAAQAKASNTTISTTPTPEVGQSTVNIVGGVVSYAAKASDGTIVAVRAGHPLSGQALPLGIAFKDSNGNFIQNQNYAILVTQDNNTVMSVTAGHAPAGTDTQTTSVLASNNPIFIKITLSGVGLPTADPSTWTGIKGVALNFSQVPEILTSTTTSTGNVTTPAKPISNMTNSKSVSTATPTGNATVPEFGPVASIVLTIAALSIVFAAKTRVISRL